MRAVTPPSLMCCATLVRPDHLVLRSASRRRRAHARRKFFDLAKINKAPIASEVVTRIDRLFAIEREINGLAPQQRVGVRTERSRRSIIELESWLREQRARVSRTATPARPSTTASSAGPRSPASSTTAACA